MDITYRPYAEREFEVLMERIHPPRVCIDNGSYPDCTLVKVDSANKHGMLLEIVQVLTDLDIVISKSYISSDGGWLMDVFHVTDHHGNKITDESLTHRIQRGICESRKIGSSMHQELCLTKVFTDQMTLEMTGIDRPGLMSEMSAALTQLGCHVLSAVAWTHNGRAACVISIEDTSKTGLHLDSSRASQVQSQLENVIEAHHHDDELRSVKLTSPSTGQTDSERRLHQLMAADRDYGECCSCSGVSELDDLYALSPCCKDQKKECDAIHVRMESCKENGYLIITMRSRDRPKLLFDTICALTDLQYIVHHAAVGSTGSTAFQEYYVTRKDGCTWYSEAEKRRVAQCLTAAIERRNSQGLRLDICTRNRTGLLSDVTRIFRENGLSITRVEIGIRGEEALGTFYIKETSGEDVSPRTLERVRQEFRGTDIDIKRISSNETLDYEAAAAEGRPRFSLGSMLWAHLERLSYNFRPIRS